MSNFEDLPLCGPRPIDDVKKILHSIKFDISLIKSDLDIIKTTLKEKEQRENKILQEQVKKQDEGWFNSIV
jgi:hypothetical protein|tara:strand:+ start:5368 stop:5580 length:213 start_codon:yes stop_codon:yes gene_type:complete